MNTATSIPMPAAERRRAAAHAALGARADASPARDEGAAFAPANIALCKYWGKRDEELRLPLNGSVSISLGALGTRTRVRPAETDRYVLNGAALPPEGPEAQRLCEYLDLFRGPGAAAFEVVTDNSIPTAAGLASSASGFAALARALDVLFGWDLEPHALSILARLGSGSAARSIAEGFVEWRAGERPDGADSHAERWPEVWPDLRIGLLVLAAGPKPVGSGEGMRRTVATSPLYGAWPEAARRDLEILRSAVRARDFEALGRTAEANALAMHATMLAARPAVRYWRPETVAALDRLAALRAEGLPAYATMDAGPNIKLLFPARVEPSVRAAFPEVRVIAPFAECTKTGLQSFC